MNRLFSVICLTFFALAGCQQVSLDQASFDDLSYVEFTAEMEGFESDTKTSLAPNRAVVWSQGDQIAIFQGCSLADRYQVHDSDAGSANGAFSIVADQSGEEGGDFIAGTETVFSTNVAFYPYGARLSCIPMYDNEDNVLSYEISNVVIPSVQTYAPDSFPEETFLMAAVTSGKRDHTLKFRNVCGALKLQLKGTAKIKTIKLKGNADEPLCGGAVVSAYQDDAVPSVHMSDDAQKTVTLDCGEGVRLNESTDTDFIIVLPPTAFAKGFTVTVYDDEDKEQVIQTEKENNVNRSEILAMPALSVKTDYPDVPHNQIWYTTNDNQIIDLASNRNLRVSVVSNEYKDGKGIVTFDTDITSVSYGMFSYYQSLTSIVLPASVKSIYNAFECCHNLEEVTITSEYVYAERPFVDCPSLCRFRGPLVSEDGRCLVYNTMLMAFASSGLTEYTLPEDVEIIRDGAMAYSRKLKKLIFSSNVLRVDTDAFSECESLEMVVMSGKVWSIANRAFSGCSSLVSVENTNGVTDLAENAFSYCTSLTEIDFPDLRQVTGNPFSHCTSLHTVTSPLTSEDGRCLVDDKGTLASFIPGGLTEYTMPENITSIGVSAFSEVSNLVSLNMSDSVTSIEQNAFYGCSSLESVTFSSNLEVIGRYAFDGCNNLKSVTLPSSIRLIEEHAFQGCHNMAYMMCYAPVPPCLSESGDPYYNGLNGLEPDRIMILVPADSVQDYKQAEIWNRFADSIHSIEEICLFYTTTDNNIITPNPSKLDVGILTNTYGPDGGMIVFDSPLTYMGSFTFDELDNLSRIVIPDSVTDVYGGLFICDCPALESIKYGNGMEIVRGLTLCDNLKEIIFSPGNKVIGAAAFGFQQALEEVNIPDTIITIEEQSFNSCKNLKTVNIGTGIETIGSLAFWMCYNLENVFIRALTPPSISSGIFAECHENLTIYVPEQSVEEYRSADVWSMYSDRIVGYLYND